MIKYLGVNAEIVYEKYDGNRTEGKIIYIKTAIQWNLIYSFHDDSFIIYI